MYNFNSDKSFLTQSEYDRLRSLLYAIRTSKKFADTDDKAAFDDPLYFFKTYVKDCENYGKLFRVNFYDNQIQAVSKGWYRPSDFVARFYDLDSYVQALSDLFVWLCGAHTYSDVGASEKKRIRKPR